MSADKFTRTDVVANGFRLEGSLTSEGSRGGDGKGAITQPASDEGADAQHELLQSSHSASDARVCDLALVDGDDHDEESDAQSRDAPAAIQPVDILSRRLEDSADDEDECAEKDGPPPTDIVTDGAGESSAEECTAGEQRDDDATGTQEQIPKSVSILLSAHARKDVHSRLDRARIVEEVLEGLTRNHLSDNAQVISVEDRPERGEHAHQKLYGCVSQNSRVDHPQTRVEGRRMAMFV